MKKLTAALLALICIFALTACGTTSEKKEFTPGQIDGKIYTNEFAGIKLEANSSWTFKADDEVSDPASDSTDSTDDDGTVYDAMLSNDSSGANIIIMYQSIRKLFGGKLYSAEEYADMLAEELENNADIGYKTDSSEKIDFCGSESTCLTLKADYLGIDLEQTYIVREIGDYMLVVCLTYSTSRGTSLDGMLSMFSSLDA